MVRIRLPYIFALALLIALAIAAVRGCRLARKNADSPPKTGDVTVSVYDHREKSVKELPLETYLVGVVAAEMPVSFHREALKAQAVAARTYTLRKLSKGGCRRHDADICTDSGCCQAYLSEARMLTRWGAETEQNARTAAEAVHETAGEVITFDGALIEALYHSASGGQTENSGDAFSTAEPYLVSVMSTNESGTSGLKSEVKYQSERFISRVLEQYPAAGLTKKSLTGQIEILKTSPSGRVLSLRIGDAVLTGRQARSLFGLKSTLFTVAAKADEIIFSVRGSGHGVGMSQTGANGMALGGSDYKSILCYYYRGVKVEPYGRDGA